MSQDNLNLPIPVFPTKINLVSEIKIATFDGKRDELDDWIDEFKRAAELMSWVDDECVKRIPSYLKGHAKMWYKNHILANPLDSFDEVIDALKARFTRRDAMAYARNQMLTRVQIEKESVRDYYMHKLSLCQKYNPQMSEEEKCSMVIHGLLDKYHEKTFLEGFAKLDDLLDRLDMIEEGEEIRSRCRSVKGTVAPPASPAVEQPAAAAASSSETQDLKKMVSSLSDALAKLTTENKRRVDNYQYRGQPRNYYQGAQMQQNQGPIYPYPVYPYNPNTAPVASMQQNPNNVPVRQQPAVNQQPSRYDPISNPNRTALGKVVCYNCRAVGHFSRNCPVSQRPQPNQGEGQAPREGRQN